MAAHDERRGGQADRRQYDDRALRHAAEQAQRRVSLTSLETALLIAVLGVLTSVAVLGFYVHAIAKVQRDGITRGLKNRAVGCAGLGALVVTVPACQEPDVLKFYTPATTVVPRAP